MSTRTDDRTPASPTRTTKRPGGRRPAGTRRAEAKTRAAMDPRLRARRAEVARAEGRRRLRIVIALSVVTVGVIAGFWAVDSPLFDVDEIAVVGNDRVEADHLREVAGIVPGTPLLDVDLQGAADRVAALPWVASVAVERSIGGEVAIVVVERTPGPVLPPADGGWVLVDDSGRQLERVEARPVGSIPVAGIGLDGRLGQPVDADAQRVLRVLGGLSVAAAEATSQVILDQGTIFLTLSDGGRVRLGDHTGLETKMVALETMLDRVDLRCLHEIDLRVASAPSLTRRNAGTDPHQPVTDLETCQ